MKFHEIARFLNISEEIARSLANQEVLPGQPSAEGWKTTLDDLERWYVKISGKEWADLTANRQVDPLTAEVDLESEVAGDALLTVLRSWEEKGIVKIISHNLEPAADPEVILMLCKAAEEGREGIESLQHSALSEFVRSQIELVYRCENIIGNSPVLVTLSKQEILKLSIEDAMAGLPQQEREIIRFHLAGYVHRLSTELRGESGHKNSE
jgi:hypothetical protein